ncbi:MAG: GWxTD domain-containing protein [Flavisolibacter sp.]
MKSFIYLSIFIICLQSLSAQIESDYGRKSGNLDPKYYQDFLNFASDKENNTRVDIFIQVPYTTIQFVKASTGFAASYNVTVSVFDEDKEKLLTEKSWREKIGAQNFDQTTSKSNYNLSLKSFYLTPGKYFIRTAVEDEDSRKTYSSENMYTVRDFSGNVSVSDIMLIIRQSQSEGSKKILPNISRNINAEKDGIPLFFEIYSKYPKDVVIQLEIKDNDEKIVFSDTLNKYIDSGRTQIIHTIENVSLSLGTYLLNVTVSDSTKENNLNVNKTFMSRWAGIPSAINDLDKAISQLVYIATPSELNNIEDASGQKEKVSRYLEFWKKKDPTPSTDENEIFNEYYRRVAYANSNFTHYVEGWRSDRGMVFILLGSPSNVDRHPFDLESKPYEVWYYYELNRNYIFVDETGFGDYRLTTPLYGDDYRYRN